MLDNPRKHGPAQLTLAVPAARPLLLDYFETYPNAVAHCDLPFAFTPATNQTYIIYTADSAGPGGYNAAMHVLHFLRPFTGARCVVSVRLLLAGGAEAAIPTTRWRSSI